METLQAKSVQSIISGFSIENQKEIIKGILATGVGKEVLDCICHEERLQIILNYFICDKKLKILIQKSPLAQKFLIEILLNRDEDLYDMSRAWQMWFSTDKYTRNQLRIIGLCKTIPKEFKEFSSAESAMVNTDNILFVTRSNQKFMEAEKIRFEKFDFEKHVEHGNDDIGDRIVVFMQGKLMSWWLSHKYF